MDSFKVMSPSALKGFMSGNNLVLRTTIPHHLVKAFPNEVMMLQHQYDQALNAFNKRVKQLRNKGKKPKDKLEIKEENKPIMHKMFKDKEEGRWN